MPPILLCPHCTAPNPTPGKFCASCGRALPALTKSAPRVISGKSKDFAQSSAGQAMQIDELAKQAKSASNILIALGALSSAFGLMLLLVGLASSNAPNDELAPNNMKAIGLTLLVLSAIYFSLGFWAKKSPLPASITGLVLYSSLVVVNFISAPLLSIPSLIVPIIVISALAKAVSAGLKHKELLRTIRERSAPLDASIQ